MRESKQGMCLSREAYLDQYLKDENRWRIHLIIPV